MEKKLLNNKLIKLPVLLVLLKELKDIESNSVTVGVKMRNMTILVWSTRTGCFVGFLWICRRWECKCVHQTLHR